jgi:hypothetical protein
MNWRAFFLFAVVAMAPAHHASAITCQDSIIVKKYRDIRTAGAPLLLQTWIDQIVSGLDGVVPAKYIYRVVLILVDLGAIQAETQKGVPNGKVYVAGQTISYLPRAFIEAVKKAAVTPKFRYVSEWQLVQDLLRLNPDPRHFDRRHDSHYHYRYSNYEWLEFGAVRKVPTNDPTSEDEANPEAREPGRVQSL